MLRHPADPRRKPDGVVVLATDGELGAERGRVVDGEQVGPLDFEVAEEAFDPGLIGRLSGSGLST